MGRGQPAAGDTTVTTTTTSQTHVDDLAVLLHGVSKSSGEPEATASTNSNVAFTDALNQERTAAADQSPNQEEEGQQRIPGAYGYTPGKIDESFRTKGTLTKPTPGPGLSPPGPIPPSANNNNVNSARGAPPATQQPPPGSSHQGSSSSHGLGAMHRARKEQKKAKKNKGPVFEVAQHHQQLKERRWARKNGEGGVLVDSPEDQQCAPEAGVLVDSPEDQQCAPDKNEILKEEEEDVLHREGWNERSVKIKQRPSTSADLSGHFAITAELVDETPSADIEARIEERIGRLRDEFTRDIVQADAVKVEEDTPAPLRFPWRWAVALAVVVTAVGVTLGVLLSSKPAGVSPTQSPSKPICTLCQDESTLVQYPDRSLPRSSIDGSGAHNITCGAVASNPELVLQLLASSSTNGECQSDVQVYANYCGCPSEEIVAQEVLAAQCSSFCRFGFNPPNETLTTPVFDDSCGELATFVSSLAADQCSVDNVLKARASAAYCMCPGVKPACSLCPNMGDIPSLLSNTAAPLFDLTCGELNDFTSILTSDECDDKQEDLRQSAGICGCPPLACSLCRPGEEVLIDPSLPSLHMNYSCAALDGIIGSFSVDDCSSIVTLVLIEDNAPHCCEPALANIETPAPVTVVLPGTPPTASFPFVLGAAPSVPPVPVTSSGGLDDDGVSPPILPHPPASSPSSSGSTSLPSLATTTCSVCEGGLPPPDPDRLASSGDGTCGEVSDLVSMFSPEECEQQQDALNAIALGCC